jgi:glycosyltransferase involved in cell wall biosynthesis
VQALGEASGARVLAEVPRPEHDRLLRSAAVYVIPLLDEPGSAGQVRLMTATEAATPVVASGVEALDGYAVDGETALLVPPGDAGALRAAIDRLLADPALARRLAESALGRGRAWTYPAYFRAVLELIEGVLADRPLPPRAPAAPPALPREREGTGAARDGPGA